jgi:UDP-N-acetylglucosamine 2-epimerase (non-hydrolysing)
MLLICYGTRPEYIKMLPVITNCEGVVDYKTLFTGQHKDLVKTPSDFNLKIREGNNRLDSIVASVMDAIDYKKEKITAVMVQGDTTTAFAVALSAFHHGIPVVHLEAGLRTRDLKHPFPEEANRQMISRIADLNLCPTITSAVNLASEQVTGEVREVGNTVLDNLNDIDVAYEDKILITLHRRENHSTMHLWFNELERLAIKYPKYDFLLPIHPNPSVKKHRNLLNKVRVVEPMPHGELIDYLSKTKFIITDSGGLQEESSFLKKKSIVCREHTERTEGQGTFSFLCPRPHQLGKLFKKIDNDHIIDLPCPYGDGKSGKRIVDIIKRYQGEKR